MLIFGYAIRTDVDDVRLAIVDPSPSDITISMRDRLAASGVFRVVAVLRRMEELERQEGSEAVAYEMLGPPRLSKLLFEGTILRRLFGELAAAEELAPEETGQRALNLIREDADLRQRVVSIGLPILLPDGGSMYRGAEVKVMASPPTTDDPAGFGVTMPRSGADAAAYGISSTIPP